MQSSVHTTENLLFITLLQLLVMISVARAGNRLLRALGQSGIEQRRSCHGSRTGPRNLYGSHRDEAGHRGVDTDICGQQNCQHEAPCTERMIL